MRIAVYPGTFDPITLGHVDIIKRALAIVDELVIGVAQHTNKTPIFTLEERVAMVEHDLATFFPDKKVTVFGFEGLLVDFAKTHHATILIRGLRAVSDFEYEFQMAGMNARLDVNLQTVFLPASENTHFIASRFVKEICRLGGDVNAFVSDHVKEKLLSYYRD